MADVIARWQMEYNQGGGWQMLWPGGRWNSHCIMLFLVLGCQTEPHPIYVADGICPHFC